MDRSGDRPRTEVSVVLPAYNEAPTIEATVETTLSTLGDFLPPGTFEVLVAEDGCDDRTPEIVDRLAAADDRIRHVHSDERLGRGGALERAFSAARGDTLVYFDTDLATDMRHLEELVGRVRSGGADVATGSRWMPGRVADRPARRGVPSRVYNGLVRLVLRSPLRDHQCGFKALSRDAFERLQGRIEDEHWFWDTELLIRAQRAGLEVAEFPVEWEPKGDTKVDLVRDVFGMGSQILRLWWQVSVSPRITRRVSVGAGALLTLLALALMTLYLDPQAVLDELEGADLRLVGLAGGVYLLSWPLRGGRYRDILSELGYRERLGFLTGAVFISQTGNLVFPARAGDGVRAYVMKARRGIPYPTGFASLAVERVFDLLTITLLGGSVLVGYVLTGSMGAVVATLSGSVPGVDPRSARVALTVAAGVAAAAVVAVAAIVVSARREGSLIRRVVTRVSSDSYADYVAGVLESFVADVQAVAADRGAFGRIGASSLVIWALDVVTAILVLAAFDVALATPTLVAVGFFAVSVGNLAKVLPLSPGGIGLYEAAFTLLVAGLTPVTGATAFGAAVLDHAVKNLVTVAGGLVSMLALNVSLTTAVDETGSAEPDADPETVD
ncbi:flippase-like domain-containing protein [Haloplanus halophilus]|uniref:flippase-like domain-containing protein n=1 Tax=Haloplanus halophilus TaxID=2949993 RepID=UPI00203DACDB|nr:flippase-like domain-containing protein [Haloplanus sp. GDY1]